MLPQEKEEIRMITELFYMPVALRNHRYNGMDFLEVAFQIKKELLRQKPNTDMEEAARVMVETFNSKLDPKMNEGDMERLARMIARYSSLSAMLSSARE